MHAIARTGCVLVVACAVLGTACGLAPPVEPAIRTSAEVLPWGDLSSFRTYRWWKPPLADGGRGYSEREARIDWYVRDSVDRELAARGYAPDVARRPDFVVRYGVQLHEDATSTFSDYLAYRAEGGGKDLGEAYMGYERGTLTLELVDVASRRVAWRGQATAVVERDAQGRRIAPAVQGMMAELPPARVR
jgi:hypothetical protein